MGKSGYSINDVSTIVYSHEGEKWVLYFTTMLSQHVNAN